MRLLACVSPCVLLDAAHRRGGNGVTSICSTVMGLMTMSGVEIPMGFKLAIPIGSIGRSRSTDSAGSISGAASVSIEGCLNGSIV